ncbi:hypothetical protein F5Y09DRAFT_324785 [Xylaria sp. FL1042]|nr:hypothetical protein F5Y09DRAFT_324785 [Xylaria sp. FL1042]
MRSWSSSSATMVMAFADTVAGLDHRRINRASPIELDRKSIEAEALHPRTDPTSTTASRQPTTSTPYAVPLTTTFVPPESCNQEQLTMLSSPGYFIWLNEPVPVPGTTVSDCYPSEFLEYYTTYHVNPTIVGSLVPLMSPLICPFGWQVVSKKGDYQACCPVGYELTTPQTALDPKRPAYGGTCYSQWPLSSSTYIEVFGSSSSSGSMLITASTSGFANYAHVIDGIAMPTWSSTTSSGSASNSISPVDLAQHEDSKHTSLASGAIAGIVVGVVATVALFAVVFYIYARRRRRILLGQIPPAPPPKDEGAFTAVSNPISVEKLLNSPAPIKQTPTNLSEMEGESHVHELDAGQIPVEKP